jgi:4-amino-4-deoxy-L-arabinose transferase-like glycosyltransferase
MATKIGYIPRIDKVASFTFASEAVVFGFLFLFTLLLRFPFFFPAVVNWDESTFLLMGQSIVDGHLPYVNVWEIKPPLAFAFFSLLMSVFGKDLVAIRLGGALCVVGTGFLAYLIATRLWNRRVGIIAAVLCVVATSLQRDGDLNSGQAIMTEHVALLPFIGAIYLLISIGPSLARNFLVGVLMAMAALVRLNMAYVAIIIGLYILALSAAEYSSRKVLQHIVAYAAGAAFVISFVWLPYAIAGEQNLLWRSVVTASLNYSKSQYSFSQNFVLQLMHVFGRYDEYGLRFPVRWSNLLLWILGGTGFIALWWQSANLSAVLRSKIKLLLVSTVVTAFGILKTGRAYEHYLLQLIPFAALLAAALLEQLSSRLRWVLLILVAVLTVISGDSVLIEYKTLTSRVLAHKDLRYGAAYEIASYLKRENNSARPVYLLTDHIAYWFMNSYPLTKMSTHPANVASLSLIRSVIGENATPEEELIKIFQQRPEFVVTEPNVWWLRGNARTLFEDILARDYVLVTEIEERKVYRKVDKN